jgi:hypothetical protein
MDCGGKRSATPLFQAHNDYRTLSVIQKRRRRPMIGASHALPAQSKVGTRSRQVG